MIKENTEFNKVEIDNPRKLTENTVKLYIGNYTENKHKSKNRERMKHRDVL